MTQLTPIELEDGTVIYIEAKEDVQISPNVAEDKETEKELTREDLGQEAKGVREFLNRPLGSTADSQESARVSFEAIENTIRAYTNSTLNALRKVKNANIDKVTLEFGIKAGGKVGIPYITEGTAESNLKITVECSFPENEE